MRGAAKRGVKVFLPTAADDNGCHGWRRAATESFPFTRCWLAACRLLRVDSKNRWCEVGGTVTLCCESQFGLQYLFVWKYVERYTSSDLIFIWVVHRRSRSFPILGISRKWHRKSRRYGWGDKVAWSASSAWKEQLDTMQHEETYQSRRYSRRWL